MYTLKRTVVYGGAKTEDTVARRRCVHSQWGFRTVPADAEDVYDERADPVAPAPTPSRLMLAPPPLACAAFRAANRAIQQNRGRQGTEWQIVRRWYKEKRERKKIKEGQGQ